MGQSKREIIDLTNLTEEALEELIDYGHWDGNVTFKMIQTIIKDADLNDGEVFYRQIYQRISDNKFFALEYCVGNLGYNFDYFDYEMEQVFARPTIEYK